VVAEQALRGADLRHTPLSYVLERTTADQPLQRGPAPAKTIVHGSRLQAEAGLIAAAQDAETGIDRVLDPPAVRAWTLGGLATVSPVAPDPQLDRLAGTATAGATFRSSGRLEGLARYRASAVFDGSGVTAWVAPLTRYQPAWLAWTTPRPRAVSSLRLIRSDLPVRFPTRVAISADGGPAVTVAVGPGGTVSLPRPLRGRRFALAVVAATGSARPAVGIAEVTGPGIPRVRARTAGSIAGRCGQSIAHVGGRRVALRLSGTIATLDAGEPLTLTACGSPVTLPAAPVLLSVAPTVVRPLLIGLRSPAPDPLARAATPAVTGTVTDSGHEANGAYTGIRVRVTAPSWLVLGESYNRGWQATCNGRSLGPPRVIDAFANGWRVTPGCRFVSIAFAPQRGVNVGYLIGALACAVLLAVLLFTRPRPVTAAARADLSVSAGFERLPLWRALAIGVLCAAVFGFVFALRAGALIGPAAALLLWRGLPVRRAIQAAGVLLVIVLPAVYLIFPGQNQGGYDLGYLTQHMGGHWVAVSAFALLVLALARDLSYAYRLNRRIGRSTT
jgi:hypothetical protein